MRPELRSILAPLLALLGVSVLVVYISSCSGAGKGDIKAPEVSAEAPVGSSAPGDEAPPRALTLNKFTGGLPAAELPEPTPTPRADEQSTASEADRRRLVADAIESGGCSTKVVAPLSEQIIAEGNCIAPGAYAKVPELPNMKLGSAVFPYMKTQARDALVAAAQKGKRYELTINSMLRTVAQQYLLYNWYKIGRCGIKLAAKPGRSNHQSGLAVDIAEPGTWKKLMAGAGFRWMGKKDRWHFDFTGEEAEHGLDVKAFQRLWNRNHPDEPIRADGGWGDDTEEALRRAPIAGFPIGATCRFGDGEE
ncbi:MAG: D-alanyl-D-alanine carboxypeptidase family protein [Polyangiaceae bacterium]